MFFSDIAWLYLVVCGWFACCYSSRCARGDGKRSLPPKTGEGAKLLQAFAQNLRCAGSSLYQVGAFPFFFVTFLLAET
uniref:Putative secreted peptide n=1 Tax=Anopheles braziliensis TaxID=58242 RepID=A0A2M3ZWV7_9DIPT